MSEIESKMKIDKYDNYILKLTINKMKDINKITIEEKITMYNYCLECAEIFKKTAFICRRSSDWLRHNNFIHSSRCISDFKDIFPEFYKYEVKDKPSWFETNEDRIKALQEILCQLRCDLQILENSKFGCKGTEYRAISLTKEDAKNIYESNPTMKEKMVKLYPELECNIVRNWSELKEIKGYFISGVSQLQEISAASTFSMNNTNIFSTKEQAQSALAYAQLTQLIARTGKAVTNEQWTDSSIKKYCIIKDTDNIQTALSYTIFQFIAFLCEKTRDEFFELHQDLLKQFFQIK